MLKDADIIQIKKLNNEDLNSFCLSMQSDNLSDEESDDHQSISVPWNTIPDLSKVQEKDYRRRRLSDGWFVLDHRHKDLCYFFDKTGTCRAHGSSEKLSTLMKNALRTKNALGNLTSRDYGLVMAGGGAKGAFEIGVWKWLEEKGLSKKITGLSGTSVGALNSVLFAQCSHKEAESIWENIKQNDMTYVSDEKIQDFTINAARLLTQLARKQIPKELIAQILLKVSQPAFTQEKLESIADKVLSRPFCEDKIVFSCSARFSMHKNKAVSIQKAFQHFFDSDYYCLNGLEPLDQRNLILASACLPAVYPPRVYGGFKYYDGGCRDNVPVYPLITNGFKKIIVIHLENQRYTNPTVQIEGDSILFHVYPLLDTKGLEKTVKITSEQTKEWMKDGYQAAAKQLGSFLKNGELSVSVKKITELNNMKKFNYESFDYEKMYKEIEAEIQKPNILVCGATGVGKSSLIKDIFEMDGEDAPIIGEDGKPVTLSIHRYSPDNSSIVLYDTAGYIFGEKEQEYSRDIIGFIDDKIKHDPGDMASHIHEVWYCVSAANKRFYKADENLIRIIAEKYNVPVMVILTKVDLVGETDILAMKRVIREFKEDLDIYTYSVSKDLKNKEAAPKFIQKKEIIEWALNNLSDSLHKGFLPAVKGSIEAKRNYIITKELPLYMAWAAGTAGGMSFVNVPFTDSVPLMAIQMKMATSIMNDYGINLQSQKMVSDLVGTSLITYLGRTLAVQLLGIIPIAGNMIKAGVNTGVAASITTILGAAIAVVCEWYLKACVEANGAENLPFADFFTKDILKEAIEYVAQNKSLFRIQTILEDTVKADD